MKISEIVSTNEDFQSSINIDFDFGSFCKIDSLIPTDSVCKYVEEILKDVIGSSNQRAKSLVGPYGTGKSHITLVALSAMWFKDSDKYKRIVKGYADKNLPFAATFSEFVNNGKKLLPVIISGSSSDLRHSLLYSLRNALRVAGLEELMPQTNFQGVIEVIDRWEKSYPETLKRFQDLADMPADVFKSRLSNMETSAYNEFVELYPALTSGGVFDSLDGADVINIYDSVLSSLKSKGISGIYVVYDEFSKYLESNIDKATFEDSKLLQDFAEKCNRSSDDSQLHMLLISHRSLSNYIDTKLPKEKVDGWRGVSGRFLEIEISNDPNQSYELISNAIIKNPLNWRNWLEVNKGANKAVLERLKKHYSAQGLFDRDRADLVVYGCFPLHPVTAFLLPKMSEKIAQNERTLFTFLCSEGVNTLSACVADSDSLLSPDVVFDYFAPLMQREYYASPIHKTYELARALLVHSEKGGLEEKIIKTIALVDMVSQYDRVEPTQNLIYDIFTYCGYTKDEVESSLSQLIDSNSVIYLRQSNSYLKLKETSGVQINQEIEDKVQALKNRMTICDILNGFTSSKVLYPSKYNEEHSIVRYFDCGFVSGASVIKNGLNDVAVRKSGDGSIVAVVPDSQECIPALRDVARNASQEDSLSVWVVPKAFIDVEEVLYKYAAAEALKLTVSDDKVLSDEYDIVLDDLSEIITYYIDSYFRPEVRKAIYFAIGKEKRGITRRRKLSDLVSDLCEQAFSYTPYITSEALNKNELTGTALHSRAKIINGLCSEVLAPNLGFVGNGQETSMMRSALGKTGVISDFDNPVINLSPKDEGLKKVFEVMDNFVTSPGDKSFDVLYGELCASSGDIAMKRGPVALYLAIVLNLHRDEIKISRDDEEKVFTAELIDDIASNPSKYVLSPLNWTNDMADFVSSLSVLFGCEKNISRADLVDHMRRWYVALPQFTRNSKCNHTGVECDWRVHQQFGNALKRPEIDSMNFLFTELPRIFKSDVYEGSLFESIKKEKVFSDDYISNSNKAISNKLKEIFAPGAHSDCSLDSALNDWMETLPSTAHSHVFSGLNNQIISALKKASGDDAAIVHTLAKAVTSLRIQDWNDDRFEEFFGLVLQAKHEAESLTDAESHADIGARRLTISFVTDDGEELQKSFDSVECSGRAGLLKRSIKSCISEMGRSLSPEEVRQTVFDVLKEMC